MRMRPRHLRSGSQTIGLAALLALCITLFAPWKGGPSVLHAAGNIYYVDVHADGENTGTSWEHAFTSLQTALGEAGAGDEIWVAAGTYYPVQVANPESVTAGERQTSFQLKNDVAIYGGFNGTETERSARDWHANLTILSGDIDENDPVADDGLPAHADLLAGSNSHNVVRGLNPVSANAILDGFVITGGMADGTGDYAFGGGIHISSASPTLANLTIIANRAIQGGGIYIFAGSPILKQVQVEGNRAVSNGGGATILEITSAPVVVNSLFSGNLANNGGGIYLSASIAHLTQVTISGNRASSQAGAIYFNNDQNHSNLVNSVIWSNAASTTPTFFFPGEPFFRIGNSLVEGCNPAGAWNANCGTDLGSNRVDTDALFVAPITPDAAPQRGGNYTLALASPALDAGDPLADPGLDEAPTVAELSGDLAGAPRISGLAPDLGALETQIVVLETDTVGKGSIQLAPNQPRYSPATEITATAHVSAGWTFTGWQGELEGTTSPQMFILNNNGILTATFAALPPTADAGDDQVQPVGELVSLDASDSTSPDPDQALVYGWRQNSGPPVSLQGKATATPTFTAPDTPAVLTFSLVVTNAVGVASEPDTVVIEIEDIPINELNLIADSPATLGQTIHFSATYTTGSNLQFIWRAGDESMPATLATPHYSHTYSTTGVYMAQVVAVNTADTQTATVSVTVSNLHPVAHVGSAHTVTVDSLVTLAGMLSEDPDNHLPLSYAWRQTAGPTVTLTGGNTVQPSFTAPSTPAILAFELVVTDSFGASSEPSAVTVHVQDQPIAGLTAESDSPTLIGQSTTFNAQTTAGTNLTYLWDLDDGNTATDAAPTHAYTAAGEYVVELTARNGQGSEIATTTVTIYNTPPIARTGPDQTVEAGARVTLSGDGSADPDPGHTFSYAWNQIAGLTVSLMGGNTAQPSFIAPSVPATLTFQLLVTDNFGATGKPASTTILVIITDDGDPDGGDPDGGDPDGGDPDGGEPDGGDPDGGEPDDGDPDGSDPDGGDPGDGDPDGGDPDGGDPDGGDPDGGDPDGGDPDGGEPDGGEPDGGEPDGGEPDDSEPDDSDPDGGTSKRLFVPGLTRG